MFDNDDDDGVEPQFKAVDEYYFEVTEDELVCFSILPFQFDENDKVENYHSKKKVYLRGHRDMDKSHLVHKKVVAWRVGLDCEQPNISVFSSEGNWIQLLNPWKPYKDKIARSILITIQMLHFVRKQQHRGKRSLWGRLWDHLNEVFSNLDNKPAMDDLRQHQPLIKLFLERDPALMKLKILHRFFGDTTKTTKKPRTLGTQVQLTDSDESHGRHNDSDSDYDDENNKDDPDYNEEDKDDSDYDDDEKNASDYDDVDKDDSDSDDDNNGSERDDGNDNYSEDDSSDDDTNGDDGTDQLCALCDDGGNLLSCIGQCKRSFHPRKKDGSESKCKTLGYTSAQLKEIGSYVCKNCEYKQHQCFKCGELEPSAEPNAKVFKCKNPSCGHFYHPKCVAKLLERDDPDGDGSCELAQRIMMGLPFTCPVHWCFQCRRMEDRTQRAMRLAACRRCPKSYHIECLPREISFKTKDKNIKQRAWKLSGIVIIYCLDHEICKPTGSAKRGHIKFPQTTKIIETRDLAEKKGKMARQRKRSIDQCSTNSTKVLNRLPREKIKHTQNTLEHRVIIPEGSAMSLGEYLQTEPSMVGAASLSDQKARKEQKKPSGSSVPSDVGSKREKRKTSRPNKEISSSTPCNIAIKRVDRSVQIADRLHLGLQPSDMDNLLEDPPVVKDMELDKICKTSEDKDYNGKEKSSEHSGEENATNKYTSHENNEKNEAPDKPFVDIQAEVNKSKLKSGAETSMELGQNDNGHEPIPGQEKEISMGENQMCQSTCEQESRSDNGKIAKNESTKSGSGNNGVTPDHVDDNPPEKAMHVPYANKMAITDRIHTPPEYDCDENQEADGGRTFQDEPNYSQCNVNLEAIGIHTLGKMPRKRRKLKKKATDDTNTDMDRNKRCDQGDGKEAHCDIQAEVDQSKLISRAEISMELGENASVHDSMPGQEKDISRGENQMCRSTCEQESKSDNGKIARKESTKSGSGNGVTSDHVDDNPPEKLIHVSHVDKMTILDRIHTQPEYDCDENLEVNAGHTFQDEPNSSQCSVDPKAMGIHTSAKKLITIRELKDEATDGKNTFLDKNKRCNQGDDKGHCDESIYQCLPNNKEPDYQVHEFENSGVNGPRCNDENRAAEVPEHKSRQSTGPSRRENLTHNTRGNSSNSPMDGNSRRNRSRNRQSTYRDGYKPYPATNNQHGYEQGHDVNYPSNIRSHVPLQPVFSPVYSDASGLHGLYSYQRGPEHGITEYYTQGRHPHPYYPGRPEHVHYTPNGIDPVALQRYYNGTYRTHADVNMEGRGAAYGGPNGEYGVRSNYPVGLLGRRPPAAGLVTDKYAPRLELTNNQPRR